MIAQCEILWADLAEPTGSAPGHRRPVVVVQADPLNHSRLATVVRVTLTSNLRRAVAPGNVLLAARHTGLDRDSVAHVSQLVTSGERSLTERVGKHSWRKTAAIFAGIDLVMGRSYLDRVSFAGVPG